MCVFLNMPYEITFRKKVNYGGEEKYFNECCFGGDLIVEKILPFIRENYRDAQSEQEDWGWYIWFKRDNGSLAIDVFCDDPVMGEYRVHITLRKECFLA